MTPSALASQLQQGLADFLRFSFWSSTPGMENVVEDLLADPGALLKGPYVSVKLPFVAGQNPAYFPDVPLGFTPHRVNGSAASRKRCSGQYRPDGDKSRNSQRNFSSRNPCRRGNPGHHLRFLARNQSDL